MIPPKRRPCSQCPFRRDAFAGYVGADKPAHFITAALGLFADGKLHGDQQFPCHNEVDYSNKNWNEDTDDIHQCSGQAIMYSNYMKSPRDPSVATLPADHELVFSTPQEFLSHHTGDDAPKKSKRKRK